MQCWCLLVVIDVQEKVIFANVRKLREQRGALVGQCLCAQCCGAFGGLCCLLLSHHSPAVPCAAGQEPASCACAGEMAATWQGCSVEWWNP